MLKKKLWLGINDDESHINDFCYRLFWLCFLYMKKIYFLYMKALFVNSRLYKTWVSNNLPWPNFNLILGEQHKSVLKWPKNSIEVTSKAVKVHLKQIKDIKNSKIQSIGIIHRRAEEQLNLVGLNHSIIYRCWHSIRLHSTFGGNCITRCFWPHIKHQPLHTVVHDCVDNMKCMTCLG